MASSASTAFITYQKPGTQPPIYVAGTFSDPPWEAHEMEYTTDTDGEHTFQKKVTAEPGSKIQYKFRVGPGDWWVLHEGMPTVTDDAGNTNHEMEVQAPLPNSSVAEDDLTKDASCQKAADPDSVSPKTLKPESEGPRSLAKVPDNLAKHILASHSGGDVTPTYASVAAHGSSTPGSPNYATVAAEVADSAALLNKEKPETPVPDEVAGKIGYRRLTSTPITEVARTAAEVADTARELDGVEPVVDFQILPDAAYSYGFSHPDESYIDDEDDVARQQPPLFSHEAIGMYDDEDTNDAIEDHHADARAPDDEDLDLDSIDVNDPTLERFPSKREEIIDTVRKLETGLGEDHASFEGVPPSPVVGMLRHGTDDPIGDMLLSPIPVSPVQPRVVRRLDVTPPPRGSIGSAHSSAVSLHAIDETEELEAVEEEGRRSPVVRLAAGRRLSPLRASFKSPGSDEDEGVVIKEPTTPRAPKKENGGLLPPEFPRAPNHNTSQSSSETNGKIPNGSSAKPTEHDQSSRRETTEPTTPVGAPSESPRIVVEAAEQAGALNGAAGEASTTALNVHSGSPARLRKVGNGQADRSNAPATPIPSAAIPAKHERGWFKTFFKLLFVDWIGGFITRLCGGRRKTMLTAGTAAVFMGAGWWKMRSADGR